MNIVLSLTQLPTATATATNYSYRNAVGITLVDGCQTVNTLYFIFLSGGDYNYFRADGTHGYTSSNTKPK